MDVVAYVVLASGVIVDMALAVAAVLVMTMEATKVCFLFDYSVLFSIFLTPLCPPYFTPMQQQRRLWASGLRFQHGLELLPLCDRGRGCGYQCGYRCCDYGCADMAMIVAVVAVIVAVAIVVVAAVAKAEDIAFMA